MDKANIIRFSDTVREKLRAEVEDRARFYGILPEEVLPVDSEFSDSIVIGGKVYNSNIKGQREELVREVLHKGYEQVMAGVTYNWFNRFIALKFLEVNEYIPVKVFTPEDDRRSEPGIITHALELDLPDLDPDHVLELKAGNQDEELYKYLILRLCNHLNSTMPFMFEKIKDYTELLFPENLLHIDSIVKDINEIIPEDDWREVEIIGWIYQYYIAPKKDEVFKALKKNVKITSANIPAATQLFTPHWIVRYLVENSLGRLWMLNRPGSELYEQMEYYIRPEEVETDFLKISSPGDIRICDPACGSGHMLVYAFDLLYSIYEEEGYDPSEIPEMILTHNLYGIEIDERAGELAAFALAMKARKKNRRFFKAPVQPNICVLESIEFKDDELRSYLSAVGSNLLTSGIGRTLNQFRDAGNFGSLIRPFETNVSEMRQLLNERNLFSDITLFETHRKVLKALEQVDYLSPKYHVVVANPPYMGGKGMNAGLKDFGKSNYPDSKSDFFAMFIERNLDLTMDGGMVSMITMQSWMFLSSFEKLRSTILDENTILSMAHLGPRAFDSIGGEVVSTTAFVLKNAHHPEYKGDYIRLVDGNSEAQKDGMLRETIMQVNELCAEAR